MSHSTFRGRLVIVALAMFSLGALSSAQVSAEVLPDGSRSKHVSLHGLDLSTAEGQRIAQERIHQMARELCTQVSDHLDLSSSTNYVACIASAMAASNRQIQAFSAPKLAGNEKQ